MSFWRSELNSELEKNLNETHHLMETRKNLERALAETEGPMRVTSECIYHREGRKGIDLVNDHPENSLMREVDTIKACQDKMRKALEQVRSLTLFDPLYNNYSQEALNSNSSATQCDALRNICAICIAPGPFVYLPDLFELV